MAVQILNDMPDVAVHRGEPIEPLRALAPEQPVCSRFARIPGRAWFAAGAIGIHLLAIAWFLTAQQIRIAIPESEPMVVSLIDAATPTEQPRDISPPPQDITFMLSPPQDVAYEADAITPPLTALTTTSVVAEPGASAATPPVVESVEYVRAPAPVYPAESSRRRERGTVLLRVLVDATGRPAQIQLERSSGYARLDDAARSAVQKALFRPHEVDGIAQAAQVLIPIEFTRRS